MERLSRIQILVLISLFLFTLINIVSITTLIDIVTKKYDIIMLFINLVATVLINLYIFHLVRYISDYNFLKGDNSVLEKQSILSNKYYEKIEKDNEKFLKVFHDINKHISAIEGLYKEDQKEQAITYTEELNDLMTSMIPMKYSFNNILNLIINDKMSIAERHYINFKCEIYYHNLDFMNNLDITVIFGNLLDNAIEACLDVTNNPYILFKMDSKDDHIVFTVKNSLAHTLKYDKNGKIISSKRGHSGIGVSNIERSINKYNGSIKIKAENNEFVSYGILNKSI